MSIPEFGRTDQIGRRANELRHFLAHLSDDDDRPWFVSDEATVHDIYLGNEVDLVARCQEVYGVTVTAEDFRKPVWQLLDRLGAN